MNELSREMTRILEQHPINQARIASGRNPANSVILRGCGSCLDVRRLGSQPSAHVAAAARAWL